MPKPLMPYGSKRHSGLIVKDGEPSKLADRLGAQLAGKAFASSGGHFIKGGTPGGGGKNAMRTNWVSRLVRLNAGYD